MESEQDILRIHSDFAVAFQGKNLLTMVDNLVKWSFFHYQPIYAARMSFLFVCFSLHQIFATGIARYCDFQPELSCDVSLV